MRVDGLKKQKGMAATEYIIGLILVAVGAVGMFSVFGAQIRSKVGQATAALSGDTANYAESLKRDTAIQSKNKDESDKKNSMSNTNISVGE
jgi:Flp pilus assembly pilin Flp